MQKDNAMPRTSPLYYIAPSAISVTPNANGLASDLAVSVARGTKVKVYDPRIAGLGLVNGDFQEWTLSGRNRRLADTTAPYTIYARLSKADEKTAYLVFATQIHPDGSAEWIDPYILSPNTSADTDMKNVPGADGRTTYSWPPIPARQATGGRSAYWWVKIGTVSEADEGGQRTVNLDTGILGTDQYNSQWHLNPDDLPDKDPRYITEDRGQWTPTPRVTYSGPSGQRTPDGTLSAAVAASLGWMGEEPITFTRGQEIDEPYHYRSLTRLRWITQRLAAVNDDLTDAALYEKLTGTTKGWEVENTLETSRAWSYGILWECVESTQSEPRWGNTAWKVAGGNDILSMDFSSSMGYRFRRGFVNTIITPYVYYGNRDISADIGNQYWSWKRESENGASADTDPTWNARHQHMRSIQLTDDDMPSCWSVANRIIFTCTCTLLDGDDRIIIDNRIIA